MCINKLASVYLINAKNLHRIINKLIALGWDEEINMLRPLDAMRLHMLVKQPTRLTDRSKSFVLSISTSLTSFT